MPTFVKYKRIDIGLWIF